MERYICIHGHFYQPPRENPWLEAIELQDSAYPHHDWNERVTAECYAPNAVSRILDGEGRIVKLANNYAKISFNFGPTLLSWMEATAPEVYQAILDADRESRQNFSGHGSALAQAYNHMILPLANARDKYTQIVWGLRDFEHRFGRKPEGFWLPETAVDVETLDLLARFGIRFTILSPHQAARTRRIGARSWQDVGGGRIDPTMAYEQRLRMGRKISIFFYDGPISRAVAFEKLLTKGEDFAHRLLGAFRDERDYSQLVHIATDGESYGHHHRFGDMALAYSLHYIESNDLARLTNYGEYLERHPPTHQVEIVENTSWSCVHGIERWRSNCGCSSGGRPDWSQSWRPPLRETLDWLRDTLALQYERKAHQYLHSPWNARNDYISVILHRSPESAGEFVARQAARNLSEAERNMVLKLLELQRQAMLMYTSCGWFFDELSGIETVQIIRYADRAVQWAREIFDEDIESQFVERLSRAKSNIPDHRDGGHIYEEGMKASAVDWERIAAHYAVSSMFTEYPEKTTVYCFNFEREDYQSFAVGKARLVLGRVKVTSDISRDSSVLSFGVLHFGDHNLSGGVGKFQGEEDYQTLLRAVRDPFLLAEFAEVLRLFDHYFGESTYSLRSLLHDEQRKIVNLLLQSRLEEVEAVYRQIYENQAPMMRFLTDLKIPLPPAFHAAADFVLNANIRRALESEEIEMDRVKALLESARFEGVALDNATLEYAFRKGLERAAERFLAQPADLLSLQQLEGKVTLAERLPFQTDFWKIQNTYYTILQTVYPEFQRKEGEGDETARAWAGHFRALGEKLMVRVG